MEPSIAVKESRSLYECFVQWYLRVIDRCVVHGSSVLYFILVLGTAIFSSESELGYIFSILGYWVAGWLQQLFVLLAGGKTDMRNTRRFLLFNGCFIFLFTILCLLTVGGFGYALVKLVPVFEFSYTIPRNLLKVILATTFIGTLVLDFMLTYRGWRHLTQATPLKTVFIIILGPTLTILLLLAPLFACLM